LDAWTQRLEDIFSGKPKDSLDLALVDVKERYPTLPIRPFKDMIPGAGKSRYGMCKMSTVIQRLL
jgi:15-cis-phytoene synthase